MKRRVYTLVVQALRLALLMAGLFLAAAGMAVMIRADFGVGPWVVLHAGLAKQTGLTIGRVSQLLGLLLIGSGWLLGIRPRVGTLINMVFVGYFLDLTLEWRFLTGNYGVLQAALLVLGGTFSMGMGIATYLAADLGAGPRDGLMLGLTQRSGKWPVGRVRTAMEVVVLLAGYLLGGPVGWGTLIASTALGPSIQSGMGLYSCWRPKPWRHSAWSTQELHLPRE